MKRFIILGLTLLSVVAYGGLTNQQKFQLNHTPFGSKTQLGTLLDQPGHLSVVWNASSGVLNNSAASWGSSTLRDGPPTREFGAHNLGLKIPKKSLIKRAWVEITDPPVSYGPGVAPGILFQCSTVTSGLTTLALSTSTLYSSANSTGGTLLNLTAQDTLSTFQRNDSTEDCQVQVKILGRNVSSGKINLFIDYRQIR